MRILLRSLAAVVVCLLLVSATQALAATNSSDSSGQASYTAAGPFSTNADYSVNPAADPGVQPDINCGGLQCEPPGFPCESECTGYGLKCCNVGGEDYFCYGSAGRQPCSECPDGPTGCGCS